MTERHRCYDCANRESVPTTIAGRPATAFMCKVSKKTTDLTRMRWSGKFGLPVSDAENCGPEAKNWRAA